MKKNYLMHTNTFFMWAANQAAELFLFFFFFRLFLQDMDNNNGKCVGA